MAWRTQYSRFRPESNAGSPYLDTYKQSVDGDGKIILVKSGSDNIWNKIQAERSSCELKSILARLAKDEWSQFDINRGGLFGDFTKVPKSIGEMRERMLEADALFSQLPVDAREKFDFSSDKFFSSIGTDYFNKVMDPYFQPADIDVIKKESEEVTE